MNKKMIERQIKLIKMICKLSIRYCELKDNYEMLKIYSNYVVDLTVKYNIYKFNDKNKNKISFVNSSFIESFENFQYKDFDLEDDALFDYLDDLMI